MRDLFFRANFDRVEADFVTRYGLPAVTNESSSLRVLFTWVEADLHQRRMGEDEPRRKRSHDRQGTANYLAHGFWQRHSIINRERLGSQFWVSGPQSVPRLRPRWRTGRVVHIFPVTASPCFHRARQRETVIGGSPNALAERLFDHPAARCFFARARSRERSVEGAISQE